MGRFGQSRNLADPVSQYISLRSMYAAKSTEDDADDKQKGKAPSSRKFAARITADAGRVYFPGHDVSARVEIDEEACAEGGSVDEIVAEFKGEIHGFGYSYDSNGNQYTTPSTLTMFEYSVVLFSRESDVASPAPDDRLSWAPLETSNGKRAWSLSSRLPLSYDTDKGERGLPLPPTFKDTRNKVSEGTAFVFYGWKTTAKRKGTFKRDARVWLPLLVSCFSRHPGLAPESLRMPAPSDLATAKVAPDGWKTFPITQKLRKKILLTWGEVEAELLLPALSEIPPDSTIPLALRLTVRAKSSSDLSGGDARLPVLPGQGGTGDDQKGLRLVAKRSVENRIGRWDALLVKHFHARLPLRTAWGQAHLDEAVGGSSSAAARDAVPQGAGHGWTPVARTSGQHPYSTTALLCGEMHVDLTPPFTSPKVTVRYALELRVPLPGLGSKIREIVPFDLRPSSGVTEAMLAAQPAPTPEALTQIVVGRRIALFQQASAPGEDDDARDWGALLPEYDDEIDDDDEDEDGGKGKKDKSKHKTNRAAEQAQDGEALPGYSK